jgi:hypothetical protein
MVKLFVGFAGTRSVEKEAQRMKIRTFSVDNNPKLPGMDWYGDLELFEPEMCPFPPDVVWFSPPCTTYSMAGISSHRKDGVEPISDFAVKSDRLVQHSIKLIKHWEAQAIKEGRKFRWWLENPRACLRNMPFMQALGDPITVWYCRYGDKAAKPTDIWTNNVGTLFDVDGWQPRPICWNGNKGCHHERAPRGSKTGTQGKTNAKERGRIPPALVREILYSCIEVVPR